MPTIDRAFKDLAITNRKKDGDAVMDCRFSDVLDLINMKDGLKFKSDHNQVQFGYNLDNESHDGNSPKWRGGTMEDLQSDLEGKKDMGPYLKARKKLEDTGVLQALKTIIEKVRPKRSRRYSEHDGDWDMHRMWDIAPFHSTTRTLAEGKFVDIEANFAMNSGGRAADMDAYGTLVWAISDLIEQCGVCTRIVYRLDSANTSVRGSYGAVTNIVVKDTGQYVAPPLLAAVFQCNFFRRFGFAVRILSLDHIGQKINLSYGSTREKYESIVFEEGKIKTWPTLHEEPEKMVRVLLEAFDPNKGGIRG